MPRPSYKELQRKIEVLQQIVNMKIYPQDIHFETTDLFYFRLNADWHFDFFDRSIAELSEYSWEELESRKISWLDVVHPEDRGMVLNARKKGLETDLYYSAEYRILTGLGKTRWVKMRGPVLRDAEGAFLCIQGIVNDITPQKYTEMALESEHEIFVWVVNNMDDGVYIVSEDYRIRFMNKALIDLVGDQVGEVCYQALFQRESVCPWTVMNSIKHEMCGFQEYHLPLLGRTYQVRSFPIRLPDGSISKLGQLKDITKTKRLQDEVEDFAIRHQAIESAANMAYVGVFIVQDHAGMEARFRYVNEAFCKTTGYASDELLSMSILDLVHSDDVQAGLNRYRARQRGEKLDKAYEVNIIRKDKVTITTLVSAALSTYNGNTATVMFLRDITERKRIERSMWLSQRLASIGRLSAEVAHEINNPLTSVLTFNKLIERIVQQEPFPLHRVNELREFVGNLSGEAGRCAEIARNLLDFSRHGEGHFKENDINEILEKTVDVMRHRAQMGEIEIATSYARNIPLVYCDAKRLQQAVVNLILNGIESMPDGGMLNVTTDFMKDQNLVVLTISDTGIGISQENLDKVFEPFFTSKAEGKGVGLGLSVAYGIIRQHQGEIYVQSEVGKGTCFTIHLRGDICLLPTNR